MFQPNALHTAEARAALSKPAALVLAGPQGCGKTVLARLLAAERGTFTEARVDQLTNKGHLTRLLATLPRTVIVDDDVDLQDFLTHDRHRASLKQLVTNAHQVINDRGAMRRVASPKIIFCTGAVDFLGPDNSDRRFWVIDMGKRSGAA